MAMSKHFERLEIGIARLSHIAIANETVYPKLPDQLIEVPTCEME